MTQGSETTAASDRTKLPIVATVREAYTILFANFGLWIKLSIVPGLVLLGVTVFYEHIAGDDPTGISAVPSTIVWAAMFAVYLSEVPLATAWHRLILSHHKDAPHRYSIGVREFRYVLKVVAIMFVGLMMVVVAGFIMSILGSLFGQGDDVIGSLISVAIVIAAIAVLINFIARMFLLLPAASIGRDMSISDTSAAVEGNSWRFIGIYTLTVAPLYLLGYLLELAFEESMKTSAALSNFIGYFPSFLYAPILIGVLSITYRELVQKQEAAAGDDGAIAG
jgi:hypothetical protein